MPSPKLIYLLRSLDANSLRKFKTFVLSPYFCEKHELVSLLDLILPSLNPNKEQLTKPDVWESLYKERPYDDLQLRRLFSELIQLFYQFIALEKWHSSKEKVGNELLGSLSERSLTKQFHSIAKKQNSLLHKKEKLDAEDFYQQYLFFKIRHEQEEKLSNFVSSLRGLEEADKKLDFFFALEKLRFIGDYLDYTRYKGMDSSQPSKTITPEIEQWLFQSEVLQHPLINAYYLVIKLHDSSSQEESYQRLKHLLTIKLQVFSSKDQKALFIHLYNYCINTKINKGDAYFFHELFDLFKIGISKEIILEDGKLSFAFYRNIITVGLQVKEYTWVEDFIQKFTPKIPQKEQENALNYNLAKVYFHQRKFDLVIKQLSRVEYGDLSYSLGSRLLLLKTYYEMDEFRSLESLLESFRIYLRRKKGISKEIKQQYLLLLKLVKKVAFVQPFEKEDLTQIDQEIKQSNSIQKSWLLEKISEKKLG